MPVHTACRCLLLCCLFTGLAHQASAQRQELLFLSDIYCPYTCEPGAASEGYLVDLLRQASAATKVRVRYAAYPWERALLKVAQGQADGLLAVSERRADGLLLSSVVGYESYALTSLTPIAPERPGEHKYRWLNAYKLGIIPSRRVPESAYEHYLMARRQQAPESLIQVTGENAANQLVRMLLAGRVDGILENPQVIQYLLHHQFPDTRYWQRAFEQSRPLHIAVRDSPANRAWLRSFEQGLAQMRADGRLAGLLARYGLTDWLPDTR